MTDVKGTAIAYAALILQDDNIDVTSEKLSKVVEAANINIEPVWYNLFESALKGKNVREFLFDASSAPAPVSQTVARVEGQEVEEKQDEKDEESDDMGLDLFG